MTDHSKPEGTEGMFSTSTNALGINVTRYILSCSSRTFAYFKAASKYPQENYSTPKMNEEQLREHIRKNIPVKDRMAVTGEDEDALDEDYSPTSGDENEGEALDGEVLAELNAFLAEAGLPLYVRQEEK
jgi:hypothetical protein